MENLRRIRKARGLTQKELAEQVDVTESMIGMIENEKRSPSFELLLKLGEALDCSVDDLLRAEKIPVAMNGNGLSKDEVELIRYYRASSDETQNAMLQLLRSAEAAQTVRGGDEAE